MPYYEVNTNVLKKQLGWKVSLHTVQVPFNAHTVIHIIYPFSDGYVVFDNKRKVKFNYIDPLNLYGSVVQRHEILYNELTPITVDKVFKKIVQFAFTSLLQFQQYPLGFLPNALKIFYKNMNMQEYQKLSQIILDSYPIEERDTEEFMLAIWYSLVNKAAVLKPFINVLTQMIRLDIEKLYTEHATLDVLAKLKQHYVLPYEEVDAVYTNLIKYLVADAHKATWKKYSNFLFAFYDINQISLVFIIDTNTNKHTLLAKKPGMPTYYKAIYKTIT